MEKKQVKTKGTLKEMAQFAKVDEQTIQEAIQTVENAANLDVEIPKEKQ
ncbi:hypothetical protein [Ammoniphilus oxalaticus]|nr:hypothetical protein [Ammoniphilus oxalaticus]